METQGGSPPCEAYRAGVVLWVDPHGLSPWAHRPHLNVGNSTRSPTYSGWVTLSYAWGPMERRVKAPQNMFCSFVLSWYSPAKKKGEGHFGEKSPQKGVPSKKKSAFQPPTLPYCFVLGPRNVWYGPLLG